MSIDARNLPAETVYTISRADAFMMLERQVCAQFHDVGIFDTVTSVTIVGGVMTFTVRVAQKEADRG
jgi:uncharacterized protein (DUF2235 family)